MGLGYLVHQPGAPNRQRQLGWSYSYRPGCLGTPKVSPSLTVGLCVATVRDCNVLVLDCAKEWMRHDCSLNVPNGVISRCGMLRP